MLRQGGEPDRRGISNATKRPLRRRRDIDNIRRAPLEALTHAGMWDDDSQVEALSIRKAGLDQRQPEAGNHA